MPRKPENQRELEIAEAAYWRVARPDLTIEALATQLELTRSTLERRIDAAKERRWIAQDWILKEVPIQLSELLSKKEDTYLEQRINEQYGKRNLPKLNVVPAWPPKGATSSTSEEEDTAKINMRMVAHAAANIFLKRLSKMKIVGLSYGRTLRAMVDIIEHLSLSVKRALEEHTSKEELIIVTIFGSLSFSFDDPRHGDWLEYSASHLTNRLARILGTDICKRQFLETPVYAPLTFLDPFAKKKTSKTNLSEISKKLSEKDALQIAKAFVEAIPTYHDVFGKGQESMIEKLDTVITSVGDLDTGFGSLPRGEAAPFLRREEIEALRDEDEAVGDIAGCYVTKDGTTGKPGSTIAKVNERLFGLKIANLEKIVSRAEENDSPGVIVIASSRRKARVISALLKRPDKVISELIISGDLAEELVKEELVK